LKRKIKKVVLEEEMIKINLKKNKKIKVFKKEKNLFGNYLELILLYMRVM
jgi:hypothetical protein